MTLNKKYLSRSLNGLSHSREMQISKLYKSKVIGFLESQSLEVMGSAWPCISQLWMHFTDQQPLWGPPRTGLRVEDVCLQHMGMNSNRCFSL